MAGAIQPAPIIRERAETMTDVYDLTAFDEFRDELRARKIYLSCLWQRHAWEKEEGGSEPPLVECFLIKREFATPPKAPLLCIITHFAEGGYELFIPCQKNSISADVAMIECKAEA